jgi:hypothetical protein
MDMVPVSSSNIESVGYEPETHNLAVKFKGGATYHYSDVPAETHKELMRAPSIGGHLAVHVKSKHDYVRVE